MSDLKRDCPACGSESSSIGAAFRDGEPCPCCGLSASAAFEIDEIQEKRADDELKTRLATVIAERDRALTAQREAENKLSRIDDVLKGYR